MKYITTKFKLVFPTAEFLQGNGRSTRVLTADATSVAISVYVRSLFIWDLYQLHTVTDAKS